MKKGIRQATQRNRSIPSRLTQDVEKVVVTTAIPLRDSDLEEIRTIMQRKIKNSLVVVNRVDQSVISGMTVRIADIVIDMTGRTKLRRIQDKLLA